MRTKHLAMSIAAWLVAIAGCSGSAAPPTSCASSRECSAAGLVCDTASMTCVACLADIDCLDTSMVCVAHACEVRVACMSSRQCPGRVCDTADGYCVDCVADADCAADEICTADHTCGPAPVPCTTDRQCTMRMQVCSPGLGTCADCVTDTDCISGGRCGPDGMCR